jgi:uncharacterized protein
MSIKVRAFLVALLLLFAACEEQTQKKPRQALRTYSLDIKKFPDPVGHVNDFESILTPEQRNELDSIANNWREKTTNEIAIVTIDSIQPYTSFVKFAADLGNYWGIGKDDKDNGLLIVVSKNLREMRIAAGYGTEKILTDSILTTIIETTMLPHFRNGEYYEGIKAGMLECISQWR